MGTLNKLEGAQMVAVCDVVEELAQKAGELCNAEVYTNHKKMLERDDLDAVYVSIPVFAHGEPELDVIGRGLPFLVEKPVARDLETAQRVQEAVERKNLLTAVGYQLRYTGSAEAAKEILENETVGMVVGKYWSGSGRGNPQSWLRQMAKSGGQLVEQATHTIDMMRYLVGEVTEVYCAQANRVLKEIDCPDMNAIAFKFANGAVGSLSATWAYDNRDWSNANVLDILIDERFVHWDGSKTVVYGRGEPQEFSRPSRTIDEVFVEAVRTNNPALIRSPYSDGVKTLALTLAMNESAKDGEPKRLEG
jgi:predicted dehydrogenase